MKIIKLAAENIQRLKAVEITPPGHVVKITGKNEQGKTSVLDSIMYALAGTKSLPEQPIRQGESKASIRVELDDGLLAGRKDREIRRKPIAKWRSISNTKRMSDRTMPIKRVIIWPPMMPMICMCSRL